MDFEAQRLGVVVVRGLLNIGDNSENGGGFAQRIGDLKPFFS